MATDRSLDQETEETDGARTPILETVRAAIPEFDRGRVAILGLGIVAALVAVVAATDLFPYRSLNHDEGVYLQQAELLVRGRLFLRPPVEDAFRPWFFVEGDHGLYSKYTPVPAAVFALGDLLGGPTIALAGIAAAVVSGTAALGREVFDARVGVVAGVFVLASPLFVIQSGVFLPYALTTALNVWFAVCYLQAERSGSVREAVLAGLLIGTAFFARPYTAVLFALPFVGHALVTLVRSGAWRVPLECAPLQRVRGALGWRDRARTSGLSHEVRALLSRRVATAGMGLLGVVVALGYNVVTTGDPLVFPYLAFAPEDGLGFGHREILGHGVAYTPKLGLRTNALVLETLFTEWVAAGLLGAVAAAAGVVLALWRGAGDRVRRGLLAAIFLTVGLGNVAFWGNYNILSALEVETDGLIYYLGPYYHYDLLVPTAVFAAVAVVTIGAWLRGAIVRAITRIDGTSRRQAKAVAVAVLLAGSAVGGAVAATTAADPIDRNRAVTAELAAGYEPFTASGEVGASGAVGATAGVANGSTDRPSSKSLVFLSTPYGPWLNHPFQELRNAPGYDGKTVYALGDTRELAVAAAFPDRNLYRYVHAGSWSPTDDSTVRAAIVPVERIAGERIHLNTTIQPPASARRTSVRVSTEEETAYFGANATGTLSIAASTTGDRVRVAEVDPASGGANTSLALADTDEVTIEVFVATGRASGYTYQVVFPVHNEGDAGDTGRVRALSPTVERCRVPTRCVPVGLEGAPSKESVAVALSNATSAVVFGR